MAAAKEKWWDTCVSRFMAPCYASESKARAAVETDGGGRITTKADNEGYFIWGDRVKVMSGDVLADPVAKIAGRGIEAWMKTENLGGDPLLELYVIDVGQGDGLLLVTPEGHHIMVDGGNTRAFQNSGKNAADFVDWKFFKDYTLRSDRGDPAKTTIKLDAMVASHNDIDHFGGLLDLLDVTNPRSDAELDCPGIEVDAFYHAGLSWWVRIAGDELKRTLGTVDDGHYTKLLDDRASAVAATANLADPDEDTLSGAWGECIAAAVSSRQATNQGTPTEIVRLSRESEWLPRFGDSDAESVVRIRVLGPILNSAASEPGLKKFSGGDSINTNGHSVVLRVDYGNRKLLLTGDLNTASQDHLMAAHGADFADEFRCDMAKGCHHGSQDVSFPFLKALEPVATVISSGDAENYDHPRPNVVAASAITGRKLLDGSGKKLIMPLVYMTEIARSYALGHIAALHEFAANQDAFTPTKPTGDKIHNTVNEKSRFRAFLKERPTSPLEWPRLDRVRTVNGLIYGLVNVRTDGETLFFAIREEEGENWSTVALSDQEIGAATLSL